jgi:zona occludens toxin (predicted ATPase)
MTTKERISPQFRKAMEQKVHFENNLEIKSQTLRTYPSGNMGLTPDSVKATSKWQADKLAFNQAMQAMRGFNSAFLKIHKKEYRSHMQDKRGY